MYISLMQMAGLARVKKTPPKAAYGDIRPVADEKTLEALIANRYEIMAGYAKQMQLTVNTELAAMKARSADSAVIKAAKQWAHRDVDKVPASVMPELALARVASPVLDKLVTMREELRQLWLNTAVSREQLTADLAAWCHRAEDSGIATLREFSVKLRAARLA
jgi:stearoyl-CoA desaturase (delta-9 desaturase)